MGRLWLLIECAVERKEEVDENFRSWNYGDKEEEDVIKKIGGVGIVSLY